MAPVGTTGDGGGFSSGTVTVDVPSGTSDGDLIIAHVNSGSSTSVSPEGTWSLLRTDNLASNVQVWVYYRTADNEPSSYDFVFGGSSYNHVILQTWRDYEITDNHDANTASTETVLAFPQLFAEDQDMLLLFGYSRSDSELSISSGPTVAITLENRGSIAGYEEQPSGTTPDYMVTSEFAGDMAATSILLSAVTGEDFEVTGNEFNVSTSFDESTASVNASEQADPFSVLVSFDESMEIIDASEETDPFSVPVSFDESMEIIDASEETDPFSVPVSFDEPIETFGASYVETADNFQTPVSFDSTNEIADLEISMDPFSVLIDFSSTESALIFTSESSSLTANVTFETATGKLVIISPKLSVVMTELPNLGVSTELGVIKTETSLPSMSAPPKSVPDLSISTVIPSVFAPSTKIPSIKTWTIVPNMNPGPTSISSPDVNTELEE